MSGFLAEAGQEVRLRFGRPALYSCERTPVGPGDTA
jgi:hypothetical protein